MLLAGIGKYGRSVPVDYEFAIADRSAVIIIVPTVASFINPEALWSGRLRLCKQERRLDETFPLGQKDVRTTMIYTHVLNKGGRGVRSPLDAS
jgi:hypothetical protein